MPEPGARYDGLDADALARLTGASAVVIESVVASTFDIAHAMGQGGTPSGTLVLADEQTGGRGRQGRKWQSPRGGGIWMSMVLRPRAAPAGGALAIRAGLAAVQALARVAPALAPKLRWPNDVMVRDAKAAGVLCEARWTGDAMGWVAVGIGINVRGPVDPGLGARAIAVADVVPGLSRTAILEDLVPRLMRLDDAPAELGDDERALFRAFAWADPGDDIVGLAADGALLLRGSDGAPLRRTDAG